jgi:hypothetical protein
MPFIKGQSGNPGGKRRGTKNRLTPEIRQLARQLVDAEYWSRVQTQLHDGSLIPAIEARLLEYAYGRPQREEGPRTVISIGFLNPPADALDEPITVGGTAVGIRPHARGSSLAAGDGPEDRFN